MEDYKVEILKYPTKFNPCGYNKTYKEMGEE